MSTCKKICLVITSIISVALLGLTIYFVVEAATLNSKINSALTGFGTGGTQVTPPANSNMTVRGTSTPGQITYFRWDHSNGDVLNTNLRATLLMDTNHTLPDVDICVITSSSLPSANNCYNSTISDNSGVCSTADQSVYVGVFSKTTQSFSLLLTWSVQSTDANWCTGLSIVGGILGVLGLIGIFIALGITVCCLLIWCGTSVYIGYDLRRHHGYHSV